MRILLDTQMLLWVLGNRRRIAQSALDAIEDTANDILFSAASIWEIAIKSALGRIDFTIEPEVIARAALTTGFAELPVRWSDAARVATLPRLHRDPFDRLLVAQAIAEPAMLYTADAFLAGYSDLVVPAGARR